MFLCNIIANLSNIGYIRCVERKGTGQMNLNELKAKAQELGIDKETVKTFGYLSKKSTWESAITANEVVTEETEETEANKSEFTYIPSEKDFAVSIAKCETFEEIREKCQQLVGLLENKYKVTTARKNLTSYRNYFHTLHNFYSIKDDLLKPRTFKNKETGELITENQSVALDFLTLSEVAVKEIQNQSEQKTYKRANDETIIDCEKVLKVAEYLLESDNEVEIALAVQTFTGRRISEIFLGQFVADDSLTMVFKGQLKTRNTERALADYLIPVLFDSAKLETAISKLQSFKNVKSLWESENSAKLVDRRFTPRVGRNFKKTFGEYFPKSSKTGDDSSSSHQLRGLYACVLGNNYPKTSGRIDYIAKALGDTVAQVTSYLRFDLTNTPTIELQLSIEEIGMITGAKKSITTPVLDVEKFRRLLSPEGLLKFNNELKQGKSLEEALADAMNQSAVITPVPKGNESLKQDQLKLAFETMIRYNNQCLEGQQIRIEPTSLGNVYTKIAGGKRMFIEKLQDFVQINQQIIEAHHSDLKIPNNQNHRLRKFGMSNIIDSIAKLIIFNE